MAAKTERRSTLHPPKTTCVIGLLWGDEGKGKIVDVLTERADVVVRYNGGANAGHTIVARGEKFALHLVPCGALHGDKIGVLGPGVALDPTVLLAEVAALRERGIDALSQLRISQRCHLVMPYHKLEDRLNEQALAGDEKIGTTARGIGPCYADKMQRSFALRVCDLLNLDEFGRRVRRIAARKQALFAALYDYHEPIDCDEIIATYGDCGRALGDMIVDTTALLHDTLQRGERILFEGAHGTLLDVDHGTYPFVTSSNSSAVGVTSGAGIPPTSVGAIVGVVKAYATRVGSGPFPTEQDNAVGDRIREAGHEFGTTTGRPRRCGWFDAVATRYSVQLGGISTIALMHLDTLSSFDELSVCTAYEQDGKNLSLFPADSDAFERLSCRYETLPGWKSDIRDARCFADLPPNAQAYVTRIEECTGVRVGIVSVGPDRDHTIFRDTSLNG
jgi:adenylosuccinate synthase